VAANSYTEPFTYIKIVALEGVPHFPDEGYDYAYNECGKSKF
jgi:hypothetical protein